MLSMFEKEKFVVLFFLLLPNVPYAGKIKNFFLGTTKRFEGYCDVINSLGVHSEHLRFSKRRKKLVIFSLKF